jgi:hypothetical protein
MVTARVAFALACVVAAIYGAHWLAQRILLWLFVMWLFVFSAGCATVAQAAQPAPPTVVQCDPIAQAGNVIVYRCQPDSGAAFLINSVGFMALED